MSIKEGTSIVYGMQKSELGRLVSTNKNVIGGAVAQWRARHPSAIIRSIQSSKVLASSPLPTRPAASHVETGQRRSSVEIKIAVAVAATRG